ncbi:uncharacterized protein GGS25DRAFT_505566 [Hypoxylon fragiforme]|uniref:uncharacterized protein n=1 Tax=Hypoxylon fragiforme TaxID=63214 RepID=UPI0020C697F6|nr:uncharacterized protein GGS25DRAFT_505566 [Hypoxylon fragiforme]KAI2603813.1 hypothetical protein GGS25DRAFT_505566 [Hypoxylon fragiforme]
MPTIRTLTEDDIEYWSGDRPDKGYLYPLHDVGLSVAPVILRISWAEEALANGHDVNRLHSAMGRPLHTAIENPQHMDCRTGAVLDHYESLDLVRWLLERGADPRLRDTRGKSAMDRAWCLARYRKEQRDPLAGFWDQARAMMVRAARKLEGWVLLDAA